jgi:hypothetical protein
MSDRPTFCKGHVFKGPDGMGFALTRDVYPWDAMMHTDFQPINGAPEPVAGDMMPDWLARQVYRYAD